MGIKYFKFKKIHGRDDNRSIKLIEKKDAFDKNGKETYISKTGSLIIYGIEASGKSHKLSTIVKNADMIWKDTKIIFKATDSLSEILYKNLDGDEETQKLLITSPSNIVCLDNDDIEEVYLDTSKQYVKFEALIEKAKDSVLMIDDIDRITGKKLELTKDLIRNCKRFIVTAKSEDAINRTLRNIMFKRKMKISTVQLSSKASVDATNILFAMFVVCLFIGGLPEAAMLVMAGRLATKGTK